MSSNNVETSLQKFGDVRHHHPEQSFTFAMDIASPAVPVGDPVGELLALILARTADDNQAVVVTENRAPHCIVHVNDKWVTLCGFSQAVCTLSHPVRSLAADTIDFRCVCARILSSRRHRPAYMSLHSPSHSFLALSSAIYRSRPAAAPQEAVGESSSILQGSRTDTNVVRRLMDGVQRGEPTGAYIWNYKKDGTCFLNRLRIWPLRAFCVARLTEVRLPLLQGFFGELLPKYRVLYDSEAYIEDDCYGCDRMVVETAEAG